jgi:hypothetical protein
MEFEFWKLGCLMNILVLSYGIYKIFYSIEDDVKKTFGCKNCYAAKLVLSIYLSIIGLSSYCLIFNDKSIARSLFLMQIIYKIIMFAVFDTYATNMITIVNLMMIPILFISLQIGF